MPPPPIGGIAGGLSSLISTRAHSWDKFVEIGEINSFLFKRDFIAYHKNRFIDNSLIIYLAKNNNMRV